jgi:hypothetical protein
VLILRVSSHSQSYSCVSLGLTQILEFFVSKRVLGDQLVGPISAGCPSMLRRPPSAMSRARTWLSTTGGRAVTLSIVMVSLLITYRVAIMSPSRVISTLGLPECHKLTEHANDGPIPQLVHFLWTNTQPSQFRLSTYVALAAVRKHMPTATIMMHAVTDPIGIWWRRAVALGNIDIVRVNHDDLPTSINGNDITRPEHQADILRLQILAKHGGIYMDGDIILLKPLTDLLDNDFVVGAYDARQFDSSRAIHAPVLPSTESYNNALIIARSKSTFMQLWQLTYQNFQSDCYDCNSGRWLAILSRLYCPYVTVLPPQQVYIPTPSTIFTATVGDDVDISTNYAIHLEGHSSKHWQQSFASLPRQQQLAGETIYATVVRPYLADLNDDNDNDQV